MSAFRYWAIGVSGLLLAQPPALLREPEYLVERHGGQWRVRKADWIVFEHKSRAVAEARRKALPTVRLSRALVRFNPLTRERTPLADWSGEGDAQEFEAGVQALLARFAPAAGGLLSSTPFYMARLYGASGHTAEEWNDARRFVIYIDPFRTTGRLHAASTLVHELRHVERYRARGFHANRAASVLARDAFIQFGVADELDAYRSEAAFVEAVAATLSSEERRSVRAAMPSPELRWPQALVTLLGFAGPAGREARMNEVRRQILLDLEPAAGRYWDAHHADRIDPALEARIRRWRRSPEALLP